MAKREPGFWERLREAFAGAEGRGGDMEIGELGARRATAATETVSVSPAPVTVGERVTVRYTGFLAEMPGAEVYLHYGFGPGPWRKVRDVRMDRHPDGSFVARVAAEEGGRLAFCFRDQKYRWDNNYGRDWSVEIHTGENPSPAR